MMYEAKGLRPELAAEVARELTADPDVALDVHVREELGVDPNDLPSPWLAAGSSFAAFAIGALIPLIPFIFGAASVLPALLLSAIGLVVTGGIVGKITARPFWYGGGRQLLLGGLSAAVTFAIGLAVRNRSVMNLVVTALVKQVPKGDHSGRLDADGRLERAGAIAEMNPWCRRAVAQAVRLAGESGGRSTAITMGPPAAADVLREALAWGVDDALHLTDPALAGSDCLVTARALASTIGTAGGSPGPDPGRRQLGRRQHGRGRCHARRAPRRARSPARSSRWSRTRPAEAPADHRAVRHRHRVR